MIYIAINSNLLVISYSYGIYIIHTGVSMSYRASYYCSS